MNDVFNEKYGGGRSHLTHTEIIAQRMPDQNVPLQKFRDAPLHDCKRFRYPNTSAKKKRGVHRGEKKVATDEPCAKSFGRTPLNSVR